VTELKQNGELGRRCRCRRSPYLNNVVEQDRRFINKRIAASLGFRSIHGALNTIDGYEAMHMIRKGQVRWLSQPPCFSTTICNRSNFYGKNTAGLERPRSRYIEQANATGS
jgi:transposase-like protein